METNGKALTTVGSTQTAIAMGNLILHGDLSRLTPEQKIEYYYTLCERLGLDAATKPFDYLVLKNNGQVKEVLYANKGATEQLREKRGLSITKVEEDIKGDILIMKAHINDAKGRSDISTAAISLKGLQGEALANAIMKCETKAKRRATLSLCGLGMLDESEVETIPDAQTIKAAVVETHAQNRKVIASEAPAKKAPSQSSFKYEDASTNSAGGVWVYSSHGDPKEFFKVKDEIKKAGARYHKSYEGVEHAWVSEKELPQFEQFLTRQPKIETPSPTPYLDFMGNPSDEELADWDANDMMEHI